MKRFVQSWLIDTLAVLIAVHIVPDIKYETWVDLFAASLLLGILNAVLRPFLLFLALPLVLFSLGIFVLFINALLLFFVGYLLPHFSVADFWSAFWGALIISVASIILNTLTGTGKSRIRVHHRRRPPDIGGDGPVIDV